MIVVFGLINIYSSIYNENLISFWDLSYPIGKQVVFVSISLEGVLLRLAMENMQHQLTFIRNEIEGINSISKKSSEMAEDAKISMPIPIASNAMMIPQQMAGNVPLQQQAIMNSQMLNPTTAGTISIGKTVAKQTTKKATASPTPIITVNLLIIFTIFF